ncbi:MAG TPA: holo-ACP synthase [Roseiflexaceae bacterium]|nr:holo-ACP synthase [Roseiflexaceae bacterium]
MLYTGIDLIEIERIARAVERWGDRFLDRVYTPAELERYRARTSSLAARWAAKEAVSKLLGVGLRGLGGAGRQEQALAWTEIEVLSDREGRPTLALHGRAAERAQALGLGLVALSLSHTREHAIASAVALADDRRPTTDD